MKFAFNVYYKIFMFGIHSFICIILYLITIAFYYISDVDVMRFLVYAVMVINIIPKVDDTKKNFLFLAFHFTFFLFLLGSDFASFFAVDRELQVNVLDQFKNETKLHVYFLLALSLISVGFGYNYKSNIRKGITCSFVDYDINYVENVRSVSKFLMYFFSIFAVAVELEKCIFVQTIGYVDYYLSYNSHMPLFVVKFATFYTTCFLIYLSTLPSKKEVIKPLLLFVVIGAFSLGYGQRNGAMLSLVLALFYLNFRDIRSRGTEIWISKRLKYIIIVSFPMLILFLYAFNSMRNNLETATYNSTIDNFLAFFSQQGGSVQLIGMQKDFSDAGQIPDAKFYSFGTLIDFFQQNIISKMLGVAPSYEPKSYELAMHGHHFGETMTYLYRPDLYAAGFGVGSCYIAEIFNDFSYIGVILLNFCYGALFRLSNQIKLTNIWRLFALLVVVKFIIYAPRSGAMDFLTGFFTISITGLALIIHFYIKIH